MDLGSPNATGPLVSFPFLLQGRVLTPSLSSPVLCLLVCPLIGTLDYMGVKRMSCHEQEKHGPCQLGITCHSRPDQRLEMVSPLTFELLEVSAKRRLSHTLSLAPFVHLEDAVGGVADGEV